MNRNCFFIPWMIILLVICTQVRGSMNRCYKCRSRGDLGECRNPIYSDIEARQRALGLRNPFLGNNQQQDAWNMQNNPYYRPGPYDTLESGPFSSGVEAIPCPSGWCAKMIEGRGPLKQDEYGLATERMCLQRPPQDFRERCATTVRGNQEIYVCYCQGDLCNGQSRGQSSSVFVVFLSFIAIRSFL